MDERFFIPEPVFDAARTRTYGMGGKEHKQDVLVYKDQDGNELVWAAAFPMPKVGDKVTITMNGIGPAIVKGYFAVYPAPDYEYDRTIFVGVMTLATKPPAWLKRQNKEDQKNLNKPRWIRDGIGCEFGTEIADPAVKKPRAPRKPKAKVATREEQHGTYLDSGPQAWDDRDNPDY